MTTAHRSICTSNPVDGKPTLAFNCLEITHVDRIDPKWKEHSPRRERYLIMGLKVPTTLSALHSYLGLEYNSSRA